MVSRSIGGLGDIAHVKMWSLSWVEVTSRWVETYSQGTLQRKRRKGYIIWYLRGAHCHGLLRGLDSS